MNALDVGAAPGGWSAYLATRCARVFAIDPGALAPPVADNVTHVPLRAEEATPTLAATGLRFQVYVCDMNVNPLACVKVCDGRAGWGGAGGGGGRAGGRRTRQRRTRPRRRRTA